MDGIEMAGRTDRAIVIDVLRAIGRDPVESEIHRVREVYCECLADEIRRPVPHFCGVLPGVGELLDAIEDHPQVSIGLLTGNFERGAAIKLGHFDLRRRFPFGAFGDDHVNRRDLVPIALSRARTERRLDGLPVDRVVVIGDTPLDVDCAQAHGAKAIGVATGPFDVATLQSAGADLVVETLSERTRLTNWIESL
jgi:phosphoglycolate phosphatase